MSNSVFATGGVGGGVLIGGAAAVILPQTGLLPRTGVSSFLVQLTVALAFAIATSMVVARLQKRSS